jgi:hypothetical protein
LGEVKNTKKVFDQKSKMSFLFALRGIPGKFIRLSSFKELGRILYWVDYIFVFQYNNNAKKH